MIRLTRNLLIGTCAAVSLACACAPPATGQTSLQQATQPSPQAPGNQINPQFDSITGADLSDSVFDSTNFGVGTANNSAGSSQSVPTAGVGPGILPGAGIGGPASVPAQLRSDRATGPTYRFPGLDRPLQPWMKAKKRLAGKRLLIGGDYNYLYQNISESLTDNSDAMSGIYRLQGDWTLFGEEDVSAGSLIFKGENRSAFGSYIDPRALGAEAGYLGSTAIVFSDFNWFLSNLYWEQAIGGRAGLVIGRLEPDSFVDISGYANPWLGFQNLGILVNNTVPFPALGLGAALGFTFNDQWVIKGGLYDANGSQTGYKPFTNGGEFFTHLELSWAPTRAERFNKEFHVAAWHVDAREEAGTPESQGITFAGNWTFDDIWMPFVRGGWADGEAAFTRRTFVAGMMRYFSYRGDLVGLGYSWEDPTDETLREQQSIELFYNARMSQSFAFTPSIQILVDPALNPNDNTLTLFGIHGRLTY